MSAVDIAFHGLRHMIASGRLGAGEKFPPETALLSELGVSRGSLREAVRMLSALGVIESRHGSGTYVSQLRPEEIMGSLALTVDLLPLSGLLDMYELRGVLESHTAAQAAARISPEQTAELFDLVEAMEAAADPEIAPELDAQFHALIDRISGNPTLTVLLGVFRARSRAYQLFALPEGAEIRRVSDHGHRTIFNAIVLHDPAAASAAAASHVAQTVEWLRFYQPAVRTP
ncbi:MULTISPECIES: FadR/GntR family transcriptional regulator [unclassified Cryobacterium]|uniref:FadR/GntR family transcriptional regulator n=1 Tax=unclassified Cryobacterium TaxID=2649013 RepID=UPI00106A42EC|nr:MULTISPECIES: FCD domain-containing protein [unclassified Cryobacterium]TFD06512.1 FadR family transcriptional regulator [Cryobacterium sp. TMT1-66-1]TFD11088.1 FadR family transcriptional regulator [Cryobacterium sp. TMT1-2-2]